MVGGLSFHNSPPVRRSLVGFVVESTGGIGSEGRCIDFPSRDDGNGEDDNDNDEVTCIRYNSVADFQYRLIIVPS